MSISKTEVDRALKIIAEDFPKGKSQYVDVCELAGSVDYRPGDVGLRISNVFVIPVETLIKGELKVIEMLYEQMKQSVEDSAIFQSLARDMYSKIKDLEAENLTLKNQLEKLKPYEQHFELEYKLRHGNKDD